MTLKPGNNDSQFNTGDSFKTILPFIAEFLPPSVTSSSSSNFKAFVDAYYQWLEQPGNVLDGMYSYLSRIDPAKSANTEPYGTLFRKEVAPLMNPQAIKPRTLTDTIVDQYRRKGTQGSLDYFFRATYGSSPSISFPANRILYSENALRSYDYIIRIIPTPGIEKERFVGKHMIGASSNSGLDIVDVESINIQGNPYVQCRVANTYGSLASVQIQDGGSGYDNIPLVTIRGDGTGATATATVSGGKVVSVNVTAVGVGYTFANVYFTPTGGDVIGTQASAIAFLRGGFLTGETIFAQDEFEVSAVIEGCVAGFIIDNGGSGYSVGETLTYTIPGNGIGLEARIGRVLGSVNTITVNEPGSGFVTTPDVVIEGDGTGATATAVMSGGTVTGITITNAGTGYTYANVYIVNEAENEQPITYAYATARIIGTIVAIDLIDPGIQYSSYSIDNVEFDEVVGPGVLDDGLIALYDLYFFDGSIPVVDPTTLSGTGAVIFAALGCTAFVRNVTAPRFRGVFRDELLLRYNVLLSLNDIDPDSGDVDYQVGETVTQQDEDTLAVLWTAEVVSWDSFTRLLTTTSFDIKQFDRSKPVIGGTSDTLRYLTGGYNHPLLVDRGDGDLSREYTYYIRSFVAPSMYDYYLRQNVHPAGLRYIGIVADELIDALKVGVYLSTVGPEESIHDDSNIDYISPDHETGAFFREVDVISISAFVSPIIRKYVLDPLYVSGTSGTTELTLTSVTGEFQHGEQVTTPGGDVGYVSAWIAGKLYVNTVTGSFTAAEVVTGAESLAVGTISLVAQANNTNVLMTKILNRTICTGVGGTPTVETIAQEQVLATDYLGNGII